MMKHNKLEVILIALLLLLLEGCTDNINTTEQSVTETETETEASTATDKYDTEVDMPNIVFEKIVIYYDGTYHYDVEFYDKNGDYYIIEDTTTIYYGDLIAQYSDGGLEKYKKLESSCDVSELKQNYDKFYELTRDSDYTLKEFYVSPAVIPEREVYWSGFYYDESGNIQVLDIYHYDQCGEHEPNDERANDVHDWLISHHNVTD